MLLGSTSVKAARKMLMKLTAEVNVIFRGSFGSIENWLDP